MEYQYLAATHLRVSSKEKMVQQDSGSTETEHLDREVKVQSL